MKTINSAFTSGLVVLLVLTGIAGAYGEKENPDIQNGNIEESITLPQFLENLQRTHPFFEREELNHTIVSEEQKSLTGAEDWMVSSSANFNYINHSPVTAGIEKTNGTSLTSGVTRHFWSTGGNLSANITLGVKRYEYLPDPSYSSLSSTNFDNQLSVAYTQPLLRNWQGALSKLEFDIKSVEIELTDVQILENQEDFIAAVAQNFLNWVFYTIELQIVQERLQLSEQSLKDTKRKRAYNLIDRVDVIRAENALSLAEQNRVTVESSLLSLLQQLSVFLQDDRIMEKTPEFNLYEIYELPELETVTNDFRQDSRVLKQLELTLEQLKIMRKGNKEYTKPDLSLTAQAGTNKFDENFGEALKIDKPQASLSISYIFPLKNTTAQANVQTIDLRIAQLDKQREELVIAQISTLSNVYVQLKQMEEILSLNKQQIKLAKQKTREEMVTYNRGRGAFTFVIQSQDEEERAKLTHALNALAYQKLYIQYLAMTDQLLSP
jgi:outer membrane protein TolC